MHGTSCSIKQWAADAVAWVAAWLCGCHQPPLHGSCPCATAVPLLPPHPPQGQPKQVLAIPQQSASAALGGSTAVGLTDLAFFGAGTSSGGGGSAGGGYLVLASGMGGQLFLWDARAKAAPSATLAAAGAGALYACQLAPGQQVVLAGSQSGEVKLWDLR